MPLYFCHFNDIVLILDGAERGKNISAKHTSSTNSKPGLFKTLFRRSTKRTPVEYLQQEAGEEVWYRRRRISITQHMERMREAMRRRLKQVFKILFLCVTKNTLYPNSFLWCKNSSMAYFVYFPYFWSSRQIISIAPPPSPQVGGINLQV